MSFNEWNSYKVGDLMEISSSKRIYAKEYIEEGIPFYRGKEIIEKFKGNDVSTELFISEERFKELKDKFGVPQKGDILLTSVGTLGVPYLVQDEEFYFKDGNLTWFKNFNKDCHSKFIYYWIQSNYGKNQIYSKSIGSTQKALTIDMLRKFDITLPPIEEQKAIVNILSTLDNKIKVNNKINQKLEEMAQAIFKQWFIDFDFPNEEGNPYKSSGGEMVESELGMIPKGWVVTELGEIIDIWDSKRIPLSKNKREKMDKIYPYYGAASLMDYVDNYIFDGVYVLMGEDGTVIDSNGYPILQYVWGKFWVNNHAHVLTGKGKVSQEYIYILLKNKNITSSVTGAVQLKINQQNLKSIKIVLPKSDKLIEEFGNIIEFSFKKIRNNSDEINRLTKLRDALLPKLMSGEIRVPINN
ncbi:restriction endonuclease subunit S [Paeniclostridium hominis]|uniref:restriction endonuclease subunit S n=1 Tax=Paeniclostridium hominis TaxID=2764329 RepID=UPI0022E22F39|nr:restriction endonuclease subunit S [Paeniclostridium hominis]